MKNLNRLFIAATLITIAFTSCTKQLDVVAPSPVPNSSSATTISDVTVSENFDWSTTKKVNFTFEGHASEEYTLVLQVIDADGNVVLQKMQQSNKTYQVSVNLPANQTTMNIKYGADEQTIDITSGSATIAHN